MLKKSKGHLCFYGNLEFLIFEGELYLGDRRNPISLEGYRQGARFECTSRKDSFKEHLKNAWGIELDREGNVVPV